MGVIWVLAQGLAALADGLLVGRVLRLCGLRGGGRGDGAQQGLVLASDAVEATATCDTSTYAQMMAAMGLDGAAGGYVVLAKYDEAPSRKTLEDLFMEDSKERDKDLSFQQRIQRMIPQLPS